MRQTTMKNQTRYWWKTIASFLLVLFTMPLGTVRWPAFLDRLGRVFIYVLCQPIWSTARNAKWRSSNTTRISDYADLIRILGYVHGALSI